MSYFLDLLFINKTDKNSKLWKIESCLFMHPIQQVMSSIECKIGINMFNLSLRVLMRWVFCLTQITVLQNLRYLVFLFHYDIGIVQAIWDTSWGSAVGVSLLPECALCNFWELERVILMWLNAMVIVDMDGLVGPCGRDKCFSPSWPDIIRPMSGTPRTDSIIDSSHSVITLTFSYAPLWYRPYSALPEAPTVGISIIPVLHDLPSILFLFSYQLDLLTPEHLVAGLELLDLVGFYY